MGVFILLPMVLSAIIGIGMLISSFLDHLRVDKGALDKKNSGERVRVHWIAGIALIVSAISAIVIAWSGDKELVLFELVDHIPVYFHVDALGRLFVTVTSIVWIAVTIYSFTYMKHEKNEKRFFGFLLLVYSVLVALDFSGNLITFYLFYELMSISSVPLVLHNGSREAIMAALKYLFYSMLGAYCALFAIYMLYQNCASLNFTVGGTLQASLALQNRGILLVAVFVMIIGFGTKAGMLPFHAWLTSAHPVAPAPASAALSSIIVKSGVLAIIRSIFYIVGPDFIRGTWVQTAWLILTILTIFMGSMLAYREKVFKKRLAYSTVSQASYILFGLALLQPTAFAGSMLHFVFHAFIKCALFMTAGIFIYRTGKTSVDEYVGIGKEMRITLWCYTFASLALVGIPPTSGFISKWYLAQGGLQSEQSVLAIVGIAVLLISALLTAGYLLPISLKGFLPGQEALVSKKKEKIDSMVMALLVLAVLAVVLGIIPNPMIQYVSRIAETLL